MKRAILGLGVVSGLLLACTATLCAQDASQTNSQPSPYAGVSHPPSDDSIETSTIPEPKPPAGQPAAQPAPSASVSVQANVQGTAPMPPAAQSEPQPSSVDPSANYPAPQAADGTDDGIVGIAPSSPQNAPVLNQRAWANDPDGDIVHAQPLRPGELQAGTNIRVHLLDRLSTVDSERGQPFRTRVATDVMQGGQVIIPAGTEIDGKVVEVSTGHTGGHGTMRLQPEDVILPDGTRYHLRADVTGAYGSRAHVVGEGTIRPDSRARRDEIEYGGAVGAGVVVGAIVGGPGGALAGGLIGAGAVTVHLLVSHPQATLEPGSTLVFQLTDPLYMSPAAMSGN